MFDQLHSTHPLYVSVETEDVEDLVSIDLGGLKAIYHKNWGVSMRTVLRGRRSISGAVALATTTTSTHTWPHAMGRRGPVAVVIVAVIATLRATLLAKTKLTICDGVTFIDFMMGYLP